MTRKFKDLRNILEKADVDEETIDEAAAVAALFDQDNVAKKMHDIMSDTKEALRRVDDIKKLIIKMGGGNIGGDTMVGRAIASLEKTMKTIQKDTKPFARYY